MEVEAGGGAVARRLSVFSTFAGMDGFLSRVFPSGFFTGRPMFHAGGSDDPLYLFSCGVIAILSPTRLGKTCIRSEKRSFVRTLPLLLLFPSHDESDVPCDLNRLCSLPVGAQS